MLIILASDSRDSRYILFSGLFLAHIIDVMCFLLKEMECFCFIKFLRASNLPEQQLKLLLGARVDGHQTCSTANVLVAVLQMNVNKVEAVVGFTPLLPDHAAWCC